MSRRLAKCKIIRVGSLYVKGLNDNCDGVILCQNREEFLTDFYFDETHCTWQNMHGEDDELGNIKRMLRDANIPFRVYNVYKKVKSRKNHHENR